MTSAAFVIQPSTEAHPAVVALKDVTPEMMEGGFYADANIVEVDFAGNITRTGLGWDMAMSTQFCDGSDLSTAYFVFRNLQIPRDSEHCFRVDVEVYHNLSPWSMATLSSEVITGSAKTAPPGHTDKPVLTQHVFKTAETVEELWAFAISPV